MSHELSADALNLEEGRLTARPAPDVYLYNFLCDTALLPEIGQRGRFLRSQEAEALEARVTNREGPRLSLSIVSDESLPVNISGHFEAAAPPPAPELSLDEALKTPPGIRQFLDQRDGWVMELTEAASQKQAAAGDGQWPAVSLSDLNRSLSPGGFTFIWRQSPDSGTGVSAMMAEHLSGFGRVLVLGESPADLEELAELPEALFLGPAPPGTPLHPISVHTRTAEAVQAKDMAQAELRNQLSDLKRAGLSLKSEMDRWADLDELEKRFKEMGQEVARRRRRWGETRQSLSLARKAWEEADALVNKNARGLLERLRNKGPDETALRVEGERRKALDEAEERVAQVRHEEENILEKVLAQERILSDARLDSQSWNSREEIERRLEALRLEENSLTAKGLAIAARPIISHPEMLQAAPLVLALLSDAAPGEILAGRRFASVMVLASSPPDHQGRLRLASLAALAEEHFVMMGDFTFGGPP